MPNDRAAELLPGEGDTKLIRRTRVRRECELCGEPATVRYTFLYDNFRRNPSSRGYGRDDCSYVFDTEAFACDNEQCRRDARTAPHGCGTRADWTLSPATAHVFLQWQETEVPHE